MQQLPSCPPINVARSLFPKNQEPATNNGFHLLPHRLGSSLTPLPPGKPWRPVGATIASYSTAALPSSLVDGTLLPQSGAAPLGQFATLCLPGRCFAAVTPVFRACSHRLGSSFNPHPSYFFLCPHYRFPITHNRSPIPSRFAGSFSLTVFSLCPF